MLLILSLTEGSVKLTLHPMAGGNREKAPSVELHEVTRTETRVP
jgi:hypothetical protein